MKSFSGSFYNNRQFTEGYTDENGVKSPRRPKSQQLWRSTSLINLVSNQNKSKNPVYESTPAKRNLTKYDSTDSLNSLYNDKNKKSIWPLKELHGFWSDWDTIVSIVLVGAKGLPQSSGDGSVHEIYCKIRLGSETYKSKAVPNRGQPEWRERLKMHLYRDHLLKLSLWERGRQKIFMGSCVIDLSALEKERTHEIWQELDDGYGAVHLSVTKCVVRIQPQEINTDDKDDEISDNNFTGDRSLVGSLRVRVIRARGLDGNPSGYCTLELENERIQTHTARSSSELMWNKDYVFGVHDVTSVLKLRVHSSSLTDTLINEFRGQVSIPLLNIKNGETRWYALKNKNNRGIARGNYPRVLLKMSVNWDPVKATLKLFRPKEVQHIQKPYRLDMPLLFRNLEALACIFNNILFINEHIKRLFEWNNRELSALSLLAWLVFCYQLEPWMVPFILLLIFAMFWIFIKIKEQYFYNGCTNSEIRSDENLKDSKGIAYKINDMQDTIFTVSYVLEITVSLVERIKILLTFRVPFLSYVAMFMLGIFSTILYLIPFNYVLMIFGIYKFARKYLNPDRILNNDIVDFISRIPDKRQLKDWEEFTVPEPTQ